MMLQPNHRLDAPPVYSEGYEELTPDCTFERIYDGRIRLTTLRSTDRATIDAWCDRWVEIRQRWMPEDGPIYILSRITTAVEELTPYARRRSADIGLTRPEIPTYCAVFLPNTLIGQIVKLYIWSMSTFSPTIKVQVFFSFESSLQWLINQVEKNGTPPATSSRR
jgi:hypothetical protein